MVFSALALFLMVADARFHIAQPLRAGDRHRAVSGAVAGSAAGAAGALRWPTYFEVAASSAQASRKRRARRKLALQSQRANQVEQLALENERLRKLLELRQRVTTPSQAAEVLYDAADPYTRKVIIDQGLAQGIEAGSPVIDESRRAGPGHAGAIRWSAR